MNIELLTTSNNDLLAKLKQGQYFIFNDFTKKQFYYNSVKQVIFDGIDKFEGIECRRAVETNGLSAMHQYFPADKLIYLDLFVRDHTRQLMVEMAYSFCKHDLKLASEFFISPYESLIKISYPFEVAIQSKVTYEEYIQYRTKLLEASQSFQIKEFLKKIKAQIKKFLKKTKTEAGYHGSYPYAASVFGPHLDSWYGSPLDGINLWWAIEGVREDNSMILYPESFGESLKYEKKFIYLPPGITLTKPYNVVIPDGSILVFNSDLLHGSHLNISNVTR
ncbi:MAG TPA: phytanoyl-CoA dioxygenase family protein, partial [Coleofasciculaceae cyanobacterium]